MTNEKKTSIWRSLDWWTVGLYLVLLVGGWFSICGASYTYGDTDFFSLSTRTGMQIVWIATALAIALCIILSDSRIYDTFPFFIYGLFLLLLFATIFNPHEIKGSKSWLVLGPLRLQPAEFAKFATALAVAKFMSAHNFSLAKTRNLITAMAMVLVPMLLIVAQKETGSALVYLAFFLMFYREGMSGSVLFTGVAMVVYFVVGMKYAEVPLFNTPTSVGGSVVMVLIQLFTSGMVGINCHEKSLALRMTVLCLVADVIATLFAVYVIPFNLLWVMLAITVVQVLILLYVWLRTRIVNYLLIVAFALGSLTFFFSVDRVVNAMKYHQRERINVLLGLDESTQGAGYNVHQSKIAIGSGGLLGKGFLNGTQTKLKYVPEQETDFIFCTIGEEEGFVGSAGVLVVFLFLILRLIQIAERQPFAFGRIYGYCVLSIFLFHLFINIGMVLGLTPVIGIPLPFFSYGGSSLWGFTILLFILLKIDSTRNARLLT